MMDDLFELVRDVEKEGEEEMFLGVWDSGSISRKVLGSCALRSGRVYGIHAWLSYLAFFLPPALPTPFFFIL